MAKQKRLDEIDIRILAQLQREGRIPNTELANKVGLSSAPCFRRVKSLEQARVIRRYVALLDPASLGLNVTVLVRVSLDRQVADRFQIFEDAVRDRPEVLECWVTTGPSDFLMRVVVKDVEAYEAFQREFLSRIPSVASTESSFALKQVKFQTEFSLSALGYAAGAAISDVRAVCPKVEKHSPRGEASGPRYRAPHPSPLSNLHQSAVLAARSNRDLRRLSAQ